MNKTWRLPDFAVLAAGAAILLGVVVLVGWHTHNWQRGGRMGTSNQYVVFTLDEQQIALHLSGVDKVVWAVEVAPLPEAPEIVSGVVNVQGRIMPAIDIRKRFGLPERELHPADRFIIAHTSRRTVALWVDAVDGVIEPAGDRVIRGEEILPGMGYIEGVVKLPDGMILIHNLDRFLSLEEDRMLADAVQQEERTDKGTGGQGDGEKR